MSFSEKIVKLRKEKNWTQQQLADLISITVNQIKRYEAGKSAPSLEAIKKLTITFGVSSDELIFDNGNGVAAQKLNPDLLKKFEQISNLPEKELEAVNIMLEGIIVKNQLNDMITKKNKNFFQSKRKIHEQENKKRSAVIKKRNGKNIKLILQKL